MLHSVPVCAIFDITALAEIVLGWRDPDLGIAVTVLLSDKLHSVNPVKTL